MSSPGCAAGRAAERPIDVEDNSFLIEEAYNQEPGVVQHILTAVVNEEKLQVVVGAAVPIGLNRHADNYGALLYLSIEHKLF